MKSTDLMIGDWIFYPNNTPQKITGLAPGIDENGNIHYQFFNDVEWYELDSAKPIPLTPEILEKNGWKKYKNKRWMYFKDGCDKFNILLGNNSTEIEYLNMIYNPEDNAEVNYGSNFEFPRKIYVHELQHALKLCGIEKEITI